MTRERTRPRPRTLAADELLDRRRFLAGAASSLGALVLGGPLVACRRNGSSPRGGSTQDDVDPSTSPSPSDPPLAATETLMRYRDVLALPRSESLPSATLADVATRVGAELPEAYVRFITATRSCST